MLLAWRLCVWYKFHKNAIDCNTSKSLFLLVDAWPVLMCSRVQNSANPCVRDMPKFSEQVKCPCMVIRRSRPFFCNLQLGSLKLQEDTSHADKDQDDVSLAGVLQDAVGRAVWYPPPQCLRRCWAIIRGFLRRDTIAGTPFFQSFSVSWTQILRQLKQASMLNVGHVSQSYVLAGRSLCCSYSTGKTNYANEHKQGQRWLK